jgi:hypothetical protein
MLLLLSIWSCSEDTGADEAFADCRYLAPEPIFHEGLPGLSEHRFNTSEQGAEESFVVERDLHVNLQQSGCNEIRQVFWLEWKTGPTGRSARFWVRAASGQFRRLAALGAPYLSFKALSDALAVNEQQIEMGQPFELQPGLHIVIEPERQQSPKRLKVILQQE